MGKIRIIGGHHRSRLLPVLDSPGLRPTLDRVKETLFNWLGQDLTGRSCLDLFAGSGSLGFEASSRNASLVVMIEKEIKIALQLKSNVQLLNLDNCQVLVQSALDYLRNCSIKFDVIFLDPPYQSDLLNQVLKIAYKCLNPDGRIYIEYESRPELDNYELLKEGKAGKVNYALLAVK